jgi:hypothetical protein
MTIRASYPGSRQKVRIMGWTLLRLAVCAGAFTRIHVFAQTGAGEMNDGF